VIAAAAEGPATIEFIRANPPSGSIVTGCGGAILGCAGELTVWVRLLSRAGGPVSSVTASLHGQSKIACLAATAPPVRFVETATQKFNSASQLPTQILCVRLHGMRSISPSSRMGRRTPPAVRSLAFATGSSSNTRRRDAATAKIRMRPANGP
jgi:hypothetical protein